MDGQAKKADRHSALRSSYEALQAGRFEAAREHILPFLSPPGLQQPGLQQRERQLPDQTDLEASLLGGLALAACGDAVLAAPLLVGVAARRPDSQHPCVDLISVLQRQFKVRDAEPAFLACLSLTPENPKLRLAHAQFLTDMRRFEEAMQAVEHCLRLLPDYPPALNQKGIILVGIGRIEEALTLFRAVVGSEPGNAAAWANLGCTLTAEGAFEEALSAYRRSIHIRPADAQIRLNHSITLLKAGRLVQGWQEHEWRFRLPGHTLLPLDRLLPTLTPHSDLRGRSVLLTHEEGIGDTLMMLRYVPKLARLGARVIAWVPGSLVELVARVEGIAGVMATDTVELTCDYHCPFISLPRAFASRPDSWGAAVPYLRTDPDKVAAFARLLPGPRAGRGSGLRVGLVWGGAPRLENLAANAIDARRSLALSRLAPLAAIPGLALVSLQLGPYAGQLNDPPDGMRVFDPMRLDMSMDDTASLVASLDIVVSVDTSVVHLAGGLGVPTILMDRYDNCWRWFSGRSDSPWYPSLTIIRQERPGDWDGVVARVAERLRGLATR